MKNKINIILSCVVFLLGGCVSQSTPNSSISNSSLSSSSESSSSNSNIDNEEKYESSIYSKNARKIIKAQENITNAYDSLLIGDRNTVKVNKKIGPKKIFDLGDLTGEIIQNSFDSGALTKMMSEPLAFAFAMLEGLVVSGNGSIDFNGKTFYIGRQDTPVRVNLFDENEDYIFVRYGQNYSIFVDANKYSPKVVSFSKGNNNEIWMNYVTVEEMMTYWNGSLTWQEEIDTLITSLDNYNKNGINGDIVRLIKNVLASEDNDMDKWKENGSTIITDFEFPFEYLDTISIKDLYFSRYYRKLGQKDEFEIIDNQLVKINNIVSNELLRIPNEVNSIGKIETKYKKILALYIPSSVTYIEKGAFENIELEFIFLESLKEELSEDFIKCLEESSKRVYYKNQWIESHDIYLPIEYQLSMFKFNEFAIEVVDYLPFLNLVDRFIEVLNNSEYQNALYLRDETINKIIYELDSEERIMEELYILYTNVINSISLDKDKYYFYYLDTNNNENIYEENVVNGEVFLNYDLHIKVLEEEVE